MYTLKRNPRKEERRHVFERSSCSRIHCSAAPAWAKESRPGGWNISRASNEIKKKKKDLTPPPPALARDESSRCVSVAVRAAVGPGTWEGNYSSGVSGRVALFPCVGRLGDGAGGNHVQQVLPLTLHGRRGLVGGQAGVDVGHGNTCREIKQGGGVSKLEDVILALDRARGHAIWWKNIIVESCGS